MIRLLSAQKTYLDKKFFLFLKFGDLYKIEISQETDDHMVCVH